MNRHTIENIVIFTALYLNSWRNNNGKVYSSYIKNKSERYLGIDITLHPSISINDFTLSNGNLNFTNYNQLKPHIILNNIKDKIDISKLNGECNIRKDGLDWVGEVKYIINGLDSANCRMVFDILEELDDKYYNNIIREYNIKFLLDE